LFRAKAQSAASLSNLSRWKIALHQSAKENTLSYFEAIDLVRSYEQSSRGLFRKPHKFRALDGVSLKLEKGTTLGIVGESGCGKSTLAQVLLGLLDTDGGSVNLDGQPTLNLPDKQWRALRRRMQLVYQDAGGALDPRLRVRDQIEEPLHIHNLPLDAVDRILVSVGLFGALADRYPHELSGGQLQRVVIARALVLDPELLVLDEPVSALDVSIQAQVVNLLMDLQRDRGLTYLFVSHDLGVVRQISTRVAVMYLGRIVEEAPRDALFANPLHPYTRILIDAVPKPDPSLRRATRIEIGDPPNPADPPSGCSFHPRCPLATARCTIEPPALRDFGDRRVACHLIKETV
jgi:oligopeptide/dipeptide ABC transporter ATP-binding protein